MQTFEPHFQAARYATDAAFGYTVATINATAEATDRALALWMDMSKEFKVLRPDEEVEHEWSGRPRRPRSALLSPERSPAPWPNPMLDAFAAFWGLQSYRTGPSTFGSFQPAPAHPALAWWAWWPQSPVPAVWPWAYGMMSSGVPGSVAWPMAEANMAFMQAAARTAEAAGFQIPSTSGPDAFAWAARWAMTPATGTSVTPNPFVFGFWPLTLRT